MRAFYFFILVNCSLISVAVQIEIVFISCCYAAFV